MKKFLFLVGCGIICFHLGCGKKNSNNSGSKGTSVTTMALVLSSGTSTSQNSLLGSNLQLKNDQPISIATTLSSCNVTIASSTQSGQCFTPLKVKARANQLNGSSSFGGPGIRVINFSATAEGSGYEGSAYGILGSAPFDFSNPVAITNPYSEDNIQDAMTTTVFDRAALLLQSLEVQIEIPSGNTNVTNRYWTLRYPFIPQDITTITGFSDCATNDPHTAEVASSADGKIYSAPTNFNIGDVLLCQKNTSAEVCADSDFSFINSTDGSLAATRPSSPVRLTGSYLLSHTSSCSVSNGHPDLSLGYASIDASLTKGFMATKVFNSGVPSYTFKTGCEGASCNSGTTSTGNAVVATFTYDLSNSIFVPTGINLSSDSEASLRQNLYRILLKPLYVNNNKTAEGNGDTPGISATAEFSLSTSLPADVKKALTEL